MTVKDSAREASDKIKATAKSARERAGSTVETAKQSAEKAYGSARETATTAYEEGRARATKARQRTGDGIQEQPLIALAGGLIVGLVAGLLIPRSEKEKEALRKAGTNLNDRAHSAFDAAKSAGQSKLEEKGLTTRSAEDVLRNVVKGVGEAARTAGSAAKDAAKK